MSNGWPGHADAKSGLGRVAVDGNRVALLRVNASEGVENGQAAITCPGEVRRQPNFPDLPCRVDESRALAGDGSATQDADEVGPWRCRRHRRNRRLRHVQHVLNHGAQVGMRTAALIPEVGDDLGVRPTLTKDIDVDDATVDIDARLERIHPVRSNRREVELGAVLPHAQLLADGPDGVAGRRLVLLDASRAPAVCAESVGVLNGRGM